MMGEDRKNLANSSVSVLSSSVVMDIQLIELKDVFYSNSSFIRAAVEDDLVKFHELLQERKIVSVVGERNYDALFQQFCASLDLSEDVEQTCRDVEQTCQDFLSSLLLLGSPKSIELSRILRNKLNSRAVEIGLPDSFLSRETLPQEETVLLKKLVKPALRLEERYQHHHQKKFADHFNPFNKSFVILQKYSEWIVSIIIATRGIAIPFANSLCEARLVPPAVRDQIKRMENRLIQAKAIMGEVRTIVQRAVVPKKLMERFIGVLYLEKFQSHFKAVIEKLRAEKEEYRIPKIVVKHGCLQSGVMEAIHGSKLPPLRPLTRDSLPSDPYRRYLHIRYDKLKPMNLGSSSKEWKFFDLASTEQSVTEVTSSGEAALDLHQLPQDSDYPPRTLIIGAPGVGKSSIIIELCKRWVNGDLLQEYDYVIHILACDPRAKCKSLADLVPEANEEWLHPIKDANGYKSLFIIDGYDEFSDECRHSNSFIDRFIQGKILNEAALIVTTRPWCAKQISKHFPNEVEILGFTSQGREEYIQHFLKGDANEFLLLQQRSAAVEVCLNIPFYLATLIEIFKEYKDSGSYGSFTMLKSVTKVYGALIRTLVLRFVKKHDSLKKYLPPVPFDIAPGEFFNFPMPIYLPLLELCALSYNSLSDPASLVPEPSSVTFDLLNEQTEDTTSGRKGYYRFLHSSIREYLAAYCISKMEPDCMKQYIESLKQSKKYSLVLEFLHGFGCIQTIDAKDHPSYHHVHNFDVLRQLCEADSCAELIESVYGKDVNEKQECLVSRSFPTPSPADFWCLGRVIAMSDCDWYLGFTLRRIENKHLKMLYEGIQSVERPTGRIRKIALSLTNINQNGLCHFFQINEICLAKLEEIHISKNQLTGDDVIPLLCASLPKLPKLKKFLFHHNEIEAGKHNNLIPELMNCRTLEHITVTGLLPEECVLLLTTLKYLKIIEFWGISANSCKASFDCLADSNVEQLQIYESHINPTVAKSLPQTLPVSSVKHLKLINCGINCRTVEVIVTAAKQTRGLQSIDLSDNCIKNRGGRMLVQLCQRYCIDPVDSYKFNDFPQHIYESLKEMKKRQ